MTFAAAVAPRQAKRMRLPGVPHALAVFDALQIPLAGALISRHPEAELWSLAGPDPQADFTLDIATATDLRPAWERMERLGIESGRLGSERAALRRGGCAACGRAPSRPRAAST